MSPNFQEALRLSSEKRSLSWAQNDLNNIQHWNRLWAIIYRKASKSDENKVETSLNNTKPSKITIRKRIKSNDKSNFETKKFKSDYILEQSSDQRKFWAIYYWLFYKQLTKTKTKI